MKQVVIQIDTVSPTVRIDSGAGSALFVDFQQAEASLARLTIPERYRSGVVGLASMSDASFADFLAAVDAGLTSEDADAAASRLRESVQSLGYQSDLPKVVAAVAWMQDTYNKAHNVAHEVFGRDVADAVSAQMPSVPKKLDPSVLKERAVKIAHATSIELIDQKILSLQTETERAYCCARILTDLRPAFSRDPSVPPTAMTILNTLRIGYLDDIAEHREFYVMLNNADLVDLKKQIDRALAKGQTLESLLEKADCRILE